MKIILIGILFAVGLFFFNSQLPKNDYSHVPEKYKKLVHFSMGAGF